MKYFLKTTAAVGLALSLAAPLAMAQTAPGAQTHKDHAAATHPADATKTHDTGNHDKTVSHDTANHDTATHATVNRDTTINHETVVHNAGPPANGFVAGHTPGDNRLPIYTQSGIQHQSYVGGGAREWHRGDRYDGPRQVVTNWDQYHANRPPSGYEYVRNGNQLVLIAIASGVVADVLANAFSQ